MSPPPSLFPPSHSLSRVPPIPLLSRPISPGPESESIRGDGRPPAALVPVSSALIILFFVTSVFAVISVRLFGYDDVWNFGKKPAPCPPGRVRSPHAEAVIWTRLLGLATSGRGSCSWPSTISTRTAGGIWPAIRPPGAQCAGDPAFRRP